MFVDYINDYIRSFSASLTSSGTVLADYFVAPSNHRFLCPPCGGSGQPALSLYRDKYGVIKERIKYFGFDFALVNADRTH